MLEPAHSIIRLCGGYETVAAMVNRSAHRVRLWTYPKEKGGTGGLIPTDCQEPLLLAARKNGIAIGPEHFFPSLRAAS